jgi:hypothetical protein
LNPKTPTYAAENNRKRERIAMPWLPTVSPRDFAAASRCFAALTMSSDGILAWPSTAVVAAQKNPYLNHICELEACRSFDRAQSDSARAE